ncbi:MAG: zinc ribbon domain-containing protein [Akkermansiaceae bacterium]|nr:zinc ribbon domain-containing protein [Akkermansiaceae bacterium]
MPLYEYISEHADDPERSCRVCARGFELRRPVDREALRTCPLCKNPVKKVISRVNTPRIAKPLSISDAKKAGFTVLEKRDEGVYEKQ